MRILIASHNQGKVKELKQLLSSSTVSFSDLEALQDQDDVDETGSTFIENATLKAIHYAHKYQMPTLADDSGLEVHALNNQPGIYSKRYSGLGDLENNKKLLKALKHKTNREARLVAAIVVAFPNNKTFVFEGIVEGRIAHELKGDQGFGYDPLFIPKGYQQTMGELGNDVKQLKSHRAKAIQQLKESLYEITHYK